MAGRSQTAGRALERVGLLDITRETHAVAESIERHVKTLDALHLATALVMRAPVTLATHDATMSTVAGHLGLPTVDPVTAHERIGEDQSAATPSG